MPKVYGAFFLGQFGRLLSWGVQPLADEVAALGVETDVYEYKDYAVAWVKIVSMQKIGCKIGLVGFSLGDSSITYLQTKLTHIDLLIAIAESSFAQNYAIDKTHTKRSILFHGPDALSNAGLQDRFDEVINLPDLHLWMDTNPRVAQVVKDEFTKLLL